MTATVTKVCNSCGATKSLDTDFGIKSDSPDGRRATCKVCFNSGRSKKKTPETKALERLNRLVRDAQAVVDSPTSTFTERHKADQTIRNADKRRNVILAPLEAQIKEAETAARLADSSPALARVRALGSELFAADGSLLAVANRAAQLAIFKAALTTLTAADTAARDYVELTIRSLEEMLGNTATREKFVAEHDQQTANGHATQRALGEIHDEWLPKVRAAKSDASKAALRKQLWAMKRGAEDVAKLGGADDTGAQKSVVALAAAKEFDKLARLLYGKDDSPVHENDTLENIQSRLDMANAAQEWLEKAEADRQQYWQDLKARDPKKFELESRSLVRQLKGSGSLVEIQRKSLLQLKKSDPAEYERRALEALKPKKVTQDVIVYVVQDGRKETWYWPDGRLVKRGVEVTYDTLLKSWCMMPGPAGVDTESIAASNVKQELIQEDDGSFHWVPEGSQGTWSQGSDGLWKRNGGINGGQSPWTRPEKIVFRKAEPQTEEGRDIFMYGSWWTKEEVEKSRGGEYSDTPPAVLPPLPRVAVADSLALPPRNSVADRVKDSKEPSVWKRWETKQREEKTREAQLLRA